MRLICGAQLCSASFEAMCLTCPAAVWQQMPAHPTTLALTAGEQHRKLPTAFADAHSYIVAVPEQAPGSALVLDHTFQDVWRVGCGAAPCQARTALQRCMRRLAAACEAGRQASRRCAATSAQKARRSCSAALRARAAPLSARAGRFWPTSRSCLDTWACAGVVWSDGACPTAADHVLCTMHAACRTVYVVEARMNSVPQSARHCIAACGTQTIYLTD